MVYLLHLGVQPLLAYPGALSSLSELRLEMLYFCVTGLAPTIHVKDLIVEDREQLCLGF